MSGKPFAQGHDPRRASGRLPTSKAISRNIRRELGSDPGIVKRIKEQANAGDQHAMIAASVLLLAAVVPSLLMQDGSGDAQP